VPHSTHGYAARSHATRPMFVLSNVSVDMEPLAVYRFCAICFVPAIVLYIMIAWNYRATKHSKN